MKYFRKKSGTQVFAHEDAFALKNLPSRRDKKLPDNFSSLVEAGKNTDVQAMVVGDIIEVGNWLYMLKTPDGFPNSVHKHFAEILTEITLTEAQDFLNPPLSREQNIKKRFAEVEILVMSIFNTEIKKEKYLSGLGFNSGNIDLYKNHSDAIALRTWRAELFEVIASQAHMAQSPNYDLDGLDDDMVRELLHEPPK
jgi:hypothetical protein